MPVHLVARQHTTQNATTRKVIFASPPILTNGTLFYIAVSVSFTLWCTGYALDWLLDQQESKALEQAISQPQEL